MKKIRNKNKIIFQNIFRIEIKKTFCRKYEMGKRLIMDSIQKFKEYINFY